MKPQFGEPPQEKATRAQKIRDTFVAGRTVAAHTEYCINSGFWTPNEIRTKATKGCRDEVRDALGSLMEDGTPFAGPTANREDGAPIWRQQELWSVDDYFYNCSAYSTRAGADIEVHNRMADRCWERNGSGPMRLQIVEEPQ